MSISFFFLHNSTWNSTCWHHRKKMVPFLASRRPTIHYSSGSRTFLAKVKFSLLLFAIFQNYATLI
uniref:Uncharacterized protein n=1 Tax=Anguilla anguilla TaxID=7936 RepID=A0A0E9XK15_ANGAN